MIEERLIVSGRGSSDQGRLRINAPLTFKETGLYEVNKVGIAADATGAPMICFAGQKKSLSLLANLPGAMRWAQYDCVAYPLSRTNLLVTETVGRIEEATPEYVAARNEILAAPREWASEYPPTPAGEPEPLKHQVDAFCWALETFEKTPINGFGQYSEQGTGKTRWSIDLMRWSDRPVHLVLCQKSTALQWQDNLSRIWPEAEVVLLIDKPLAERAEMLSDYRKRTKSAQIIPPQVFVLNWEALARLVKPLCTIDWGVVVADEATRLKERTTQIARAAYKLAEHADKRVAMTGTPMGNHPGDLWSLYRFMEPTIFGTSFWNFMRQYFLLGGFSGNDFVGFNPLQIARFIEKMYGCAYRTTKATISDMPERSFERVSIPLSSEQQRLYEQVETDMYARLTREDGTVQELSVANALVLITRLQQITSGLFPIQTEFGKRSVCERIRSAKTEWLVNYVRDALADTDQRIVIWCRFRPELDAIRDELTKLGLAPDTDFGVIQGGVKMPDRERLRKAFNDRQSSLRVLLCQIRAAAYGLDLPAGDVMIYHSQSFSYLDRCQSMDRGHRMGRTRPYQILDLATYLQPTKKGGRRKETVDDEILKALQRKQDLSEMLLVTGFGDQ
jgi:SNF2 family DNA or RNA helicase